jgi:peptidyl-dipeptidase A
VRRPDGRHAPDWAAKIHLTVAPVYYQNYLYGELVASQLQATLDARAGGVVDESAAGRFLVDEVFRPGASLRWDRLVERATGEPLTAAHLARELAA